MLLLVPVDGSLAGMDAVRHVWTLARQGLDVQVLLANVQDGPHLYEVVLAHDADLLAGASHDAGEHVLAPAMALLRSAKVPVRGEVLIGEPGHQLVDLAEREQCHGIVMGSQGVGLLGGARLGSVCQWVLLHASVPVTIVRHAVPDTD